MSRNGVVNIQQQNNKKEITIISYFGVNFIVNIRTGKNGTKFKEFCLEKIFLNDRSFHT